MPSPCLPRFTTDSDTECNGRRGLRRRPRRIRGISSRRQQLDLRYKSANERGGRQQHAGYGHPRARYGRTQVWIQAVVGLIRISDGEFVDVAWGGRRRVAVNGVYRAGHLADGGPELADGHDERQNERTHSVAVDAV